MNEIKPASTKQINFAKGLLKRKGQTIPANFEQYNSLEMSKLIDELQGAKDATTNPALIEEPQEIKEHLIIKNFNPVQMGMVKKIIAGSQQHNLDYFLGNPDEFAERCLRLYIAFERADDHVKRQFPEVKG